MDGLTSKFIPIVISDFNARECRGVKKLCRSEKPGFSAISVFPRALFCIRQHVDLLEAHGITPFQTRFTACVTNWVASHPWSIEELFDRVMRTVSGNWFAR
jgi:hypothetical protein